MLVHPLKGAFGGAERYLELLASGLSRQNFDVSLFCFGNRSEDDNNVFARLRSAGRRAFSTASARNPLPLWKALRSTGSEIVHWNFLDPFAFEGGAFLLFPWSRPQVITDHLPMMRARAHRELTRRLANRRTGAVIVVGNAGEQAAQAHWGRQPTVVVRNGIEVPTQVAREPPKPDEPIRLLFIGRLESQKDPLFAVDVLRATLAIGRNARLRIVGDGSLRRAIADATGGAQNREAIEIAGFAVDPVAEMANAHFLLAPSRFEGMPFTPIEALASGLPVVASDIPPHRELREHTSAIALLPPKDPASWARTVVELSRDLTQLSSAAMKIAEAFSVNRMVTETIAVYEAVFRRDRRQVGLRL